MLRPTKPREDRKGWRGLLHRQGHQLFFVSCLQGGTGFRVVSLASVILPTLLFPGLLCFCFDPQMYDFKEFKPEGLFIKKGMTQELKVSVWAHMA